MRVSRLVQQWTAAEFGGLCTVFVDSRDPTWGGSRVTELRAALQQLESAGAPHADLAEASFRLATEYVRLGDWDRAVDLLAEVRAADLAADVAVGDAQPHWLLSVQAHLGRAIAATCNAPGPACVLAPGAAPARARDDLVAVTDLADQALRMRLDEGDELRVAWLLNLAATLLGDEAAPLTLRAQVDLARYQADNDLGSMNEVAAAAGVDVFDLAGGALVDDFNNDGRLDIVTTTMDPCGQAHYFENAGDGTFVDRSIESGLANQPAALNGVQVDYDNDGWLDIFLVRGAWLFANGEIRNSLLRNQGDGTFEDVTAQAGLAAPAYASQVAAWGDFDNDGWLDVYIANEEAGAGQPYPSQLFRNNGDGTFTDVAPQAGVVNGRMAKGATWGDFDNDGRIDLYVSNFGPNRLYRNNDDGTSTDVAAAAGVTEPQTDSFATWFWDYNNDGWLDIFVAKRNNDVAEYLLDLLGEGRPSAWPRLYRNRGDGTFDDVTSQTGLDRVFMAMGAGYGDLDLDGWPDIYIGTGAPGPEAVVPNALLHNHAGEEFAGAAIRAGVAVLQKGHGAAFGDLDNDGDPDIYHQVGGMYPGDKARNVLFENPSEAAAWITLSLVGRQSNSFGVGARIRVTTSSAGGARDVHALVGTGSSFGASSLQAEIGLGDSDAVREIQVTWPSGQIDIFTDLEVRRFYRITEGVVDAEVVARPTFRLPSAASSP